MRGVTRDTYERVQKIMISTHTPHARRDILIPIALTINLVFQLTRLMRGVTLYP